MMNVLEFQFISFFHDDRTKFQRVVFQRWNKIINGGKMELKFLNIRDRTLVLIKLLRLYVLGFSYEQLPGCPENVTMLPSYM